MSGTVTLMANASDNVAVAQVQFKLDGANLGAAVTAAPYTMSWDTTPSTNANHTLTAVATDTSNNSATSTSVIGEGIESQAGHQFVHGESHGD